MAIDWFTLISQVINFLVLAWLLKYFLYSRIVDAMNEREAKIAGRLEAAAQLRTVAEEEKSQYKLKTRELEEQREQFLENARNEAEACRQQLTEAAHRKAEEAQAQWFASLQREQRDLLQEFRERLGQQVFSISRRALKELANADLEQEMMRIFLKRLQTLTPVENEVIASAVQNSGHEVEIRTAFPLSPEGQESMTQSLREFLKAGLQVQFTTVPDLICGIELRAQSQRLMWNLESYLVGLEDHVFQVLEESATKYATPT